MSENREQVFENEEFQVLLRKYEDMRSGSQSIFFDVEEFEQIIVRTGETGEAAIVKVADVGRAELGAQNYSTGSKVNGSTATVLRPWRWFSSMTWRSSTARLNGPIIITPSTNGNAMAITIKTPHPMAVCFKQPQVFSSKASPSEM